MIRTYIQNENETAVIAVLSYAALDKSFCSRFGAILRLTVRYPPESFLFCPHVAVLWLLAPLSAHIVPPAPVRVPSSPLRAILRLRVSSLPCEATSFSNR